MFGKRGTTGGNGFGDRPAPPSGAAAATATELLAPPQTATDAARKADPKPTAAAARPAPPAAVAATVRRSENYYDVKSTIFAALLDTIDLSQLAKLDIESAREE